MAEIPYHGEDFKGAVKQQHVEDSESLSHEEDSKGKSKQQRVLHPAASKETLTREPEEILRSKPLGFKGLELDLIEIDLDKFERESKISSPGRRNTVWKATYSSPSGPRTVAIKNCARFKREEALILQQLRHPNIIQLLGVIPLPLDGYAIVTEYAEKGSLYDLIKQHSDDWSDFKKHCWIKWAVEMARGLQHIHEQKYKHGNVKSPSMVITRDDTLKICGFGTATHCEDTFSTDSIRGSLAWMAPEAMDDPRSQIKPIVTLKSDVFSYAVVVWELLTGKAPFPEESTFAIIKAVAIERRCQEIPTECPELIRDLLTECWNHDYRERPSMDEILCRFELYTDYSVIGKETSTREPKGILLTEPLTMRTVEIKGDTSREPVHQQLASRHGEPVSGGTTNADKGTSSKRNLLQTLLEEFRKMTAGFTGAELLKKTFKLPYIAITYINDRGRSLTLEKYSVHMYIPRGALAKSSPQLVYIFVDPSAPPVDGVNPPYVALSPMIQCGPTGLEFLDSVVLSFPHHASNEWDLSTRMCHSNEGAPKIWQPLNAKTDGAMVLSRDNKVVLLLKHFTLFVAGGTPSEASAKLMKAGAFGSLYDPSDPRYAVRTHVWNNDPVAEKKVIDMENNLDSKPLDVYRDVQVFYNQGDLGATIDNIKTGWEVEEKTPKEQKIPKIAVWLFSTNSVTFDLTRETNDGATSSLSTQPDKSPPGCDSFVYQLKADSADSSWEGHRVRLSIRPKQGKSSPSAEILERQEEELCQICHQNPSSNAGICAACREELKGALTDNTGKETDGELGGLSKKTVKKLSRFLKNESGGRSNTIRLAEELFGQGTKLIATLRRGMDNPAKQVLKLYFSFKREDHVPDQDAVGGLLEVFRSLDMGEAVQIVQAALNSQGFCRITAPTGDSRNILPCEEYTTHSQANSLERADEKFLWQLAEQLGPEWEKLAAFLGFTRADLYRIKKNDVEHVEKQIVTMLVRWRKRCVISGNDWKCKLAEQLEKVELPALAEFVNAYAPSPEVKDSANEEQFNSCKEAQQVC